MGSRNVSEDVVSALGDVHGLFNGGVSTAHLKQAILQGVLADHHSEKHSHLIISKTEQMRISVSTRRKTSRFASHTEFHLTLHSAVPSMRPECSDSQATQRFWPP